MKINMNEKVQEISIRYDNFRPQNKEDIIIEFVENEVNNKLSGLLFLKTYLCREHGFFSRDALKLIAKFSVNRI